eukprot:751704-Hanusia_phi.AAC.1
MPAHVRTMTRTRNMRAQPDCRFRRSRSCEPLSMNRRSPCCLQRLIVGSPGSTVSLQLRRPESG